MDLLLDKGADPNAEGGTTDLTVQGVHAQPMKIALKTPSYAEQLRDVGTEGGNGRNNIWGKPLQAAVHVANWHVSDEFISVNFDRLRVIKSLLAHGADVNGRNTDMETAWSGARYRRRSGRRDRVSLRGQIRRRRGDAAAARAWRRSQDQHRRSTSRR